MQYEKIHIDEERNSLLWYLITLAAIAIASFLLIDTFIAAISGIIIYKLLIAIILYAVAAYGIGRITKPLFHFDLFFDNKRLLIDIYKNDDEFFDRQELPLSEIDELRIAPHTPRSRNDALFDFATNYYLLYRSNQGGNFKRLIYPEEKLFTFKVKDIRKIIGFWQFMMKRLLFLPIMNFLWENLSINRGYFPYHYSSINTDTKSL